MFLVALCCMNSFRLDPLSSIQINVYDENKVNISDMSDEERKTVHYRFYNKWIGAMQVPLYDVLTLGSVSEVWQDNTEYLVSRHITLSKISLVVVYQHHMFPCQKDKNDDLKP